LKRAPEIVAAARSADASTRAIHSTGWNAGQRRAERAEISATLDAIKKLVN